ncbi:cobalamin biosynthesis protein [Novosphingobium lindaniclasticum]
MIVAGFGFRAGANLVSLERALAGACAGLPPIAALAAPCDKAPQLKALADRLGLPLLAIDAERLRAASTITRSAASLAARGTGSVAEAAALAACGPAARLLAPRHVSSDRMATCAIAEGVQP